MIKIRLWREGLKTALTKVVFLMGCDQRRLCAARCHANSRGNRGGCDHTNGRIDFVVFTNAHAKACQRCLRA